MNFRTRDPIHNFISLTDDLAKVVDTFVLQRLRGIRQLAMASLVYHGALHTRFDHTLGVCHVAEKMARHLELDAGEIHLVQLASLLHDIGHGPFSHVSETSLEWFGDKTKLNKDQKEHKIHEEITAEIIRNDPELSKLFPSNDHREQIIQLLGDWKGRPVLKQIVSGPLDADKQDYLLRDSYFCGVRYGQFDLAQLQRSLVLPGKDEDLMIDEDGIHPVEQFVLAKYYMTANVYRHRVRLITDQMITRAIRLGIEVDQLESMQRLYRFDGTSEFIQNYLEWDDARFMESFCPMSRKPLGKLSGSLLMRLRQRKLLKEVFRDRIDKNYDARSWETLIGLHKSKSIKLAKAVEESVADHLNKSLNVPAEKAIDPNFVIAHSFTIKSARESSKNDEAGILVDVKPHPQEFTNESTLFRSINEAFQDNTIVIFAPIEWPSLDAKKSLQSQWHEPIREIIRTTWRIQQ